MSINGESGDMVPAFLAKLWRLVNDPKTDDFISWNEDGLSFVIKDQAIFAKELLPKNFKHNNMASMVRQLNKYGFHKRIGDISLPKSAKNIEYLHPKFKRDHPFLLKTIKYRLPFTKKLKANVDLEPETIMNAMKAVRSLKRISSSRFLAIRRQNQNLWSNVISIRNSLQNQQKLINDLLRSVINTSNTSNDLSNSTQFLNKDSKLINKELKSLDSTSIKIEYPEENQNFNDFIDQFDNERESNVSILNEESNSFWEFQNFDESYLPSDEGENYNDPLSSNHSESPLTSSKITKYDCFDSKELNDYNDISYKLEDNFAQKSSKKGEVGKSFNQKRYGNKGFKNFKLHNDNATFQGLSIEAILKMSSSEQEKLIHHLSLKQSEQEFHP